MNFISFKVYPIIILLLLIGCDYSHESNIPMYVKQQDRVTIFPEPVAPDTIILIVDKVFPRNEDVLISSINQVTVDNNGRVYLGDNNQKKVYVFEPDGKFLSKIGNEGRGPGEFSFISGLKATFNQLLVLDSVLLRLSKFPLDSLNLQESVKLSSGDINKISGIERSSPGHFIIRNDGQILVGFRSPINLQNVKDERYISYYLLNNYGKIIGNELLKLKERKIYLNTHGDIPRYPQFSFSPHSLITLSNDNQIISAWSQDFLIDIRSEKGEYLRSIYYPFNKVSIDKNELLDKYTDPVRQRIIRNEVFLKTWPALNNILIDDKKRLWVSTIVEDFEVNQWWILDYSGKLVARFKWPRNRSIEMVKNGFVYTREIEEKSGLQQVVRYRFEVDEI